MKDKLNDWLLAALIIGMTIGLIPFMLAEMLLEKLRDIPVAWRHDMQMRREEQAMRRRLATLQRDTAEYYQRIERARWEEQ